jgi:NADH-quinone oxidoreductase subunit H
MLAETNRAPFDLPEAEAELVAGYNVEYSSIQFAMFFLGEYSNMLFISSVITILFFGGGLWSANNGFFIWTFIIKLLFFCFLFVVVRAAFPRFRYDQLMELGWKVFLPVMLSYAILVASLNVII